MASLGLVLAIERFDAERGVEFSSFAVPTILGELRRHFRDFGWAIHVTRSDQELVLKVNRETEQLSQRLGRSPTPQEIADATRLSVEQVVRALEVAASARPQLDRRADEFRRRVDHAHRAPGLRRSGLRARRVSRGGVQGPGRPDPPRARGALHALLPGHDPVRDR